PPVGEEQHAIARVERQALVEQGLNVLAPLLTASDQIGVRQGPDGGWRRLAAHDSDCLLEDRINLLVVTQPLEDRGQVMQCEEVIGFVFQEASKEWQVPSMLARLVTFVADVLEKE